MSDKKDRPQRIDEGYQPKQDNSDTLKKGYQPSSVGASSDTQVGQSNETPPTGGSSVQPAESSGEQKEK